jgi:hypothetical protein
LFPKPVLPLVLHIIVYAVSLVLMFFGMFFQDGFPAIYMGTILFWISCYSLPFMIFYVIFILYQSRQNTIVLMCVIWVLVMGSQIVSMTLSMARQSHQIVVSMARGVLGSRGVDKDSFVTGVFTEG